MLVISVRIDCYFVFYVPDNIAVLSGYQRWYLCVNVVIWIIFGGKSVKMNKLATFLFTYSTRGFSSVKKNRYSIWWLRGTYTRCTASMVIWIFDVQYPCYNIMVRISHDSQQRAYQNVWNTFIAADQLDAHTFHQKTYLTYALNQDI